MHFRNDLSGKTEPSVSALCRLSVSTVGRHTVGGKSSSHGRSPKIYRPERFRFCVLSTGTGRPLCPPSLFTVGPSDVQDTLKKYLEDKR